MEEVEYIEYTIRVNHRIAGRLKLALGLTKEQIEEAVRSDVGVRIWIRGERIRQVFVEVGNCVNLITSMY